MSVFPFKYTDEVFPVEIFKLYNSKMTEFCVEAMG
jgi:hypothetical protein